MTHDELPSIHHGAHTHSIVGPEAWSRTLPAEQHLWKTKQWDYDLLRRAGNAHNSKKQDKAKMTKTNESELRYVRIFITDPDARVPMETRVLYHGDERLTDLTDAELFYELDIKLFLDTHNSARAGVVWENDKGEEVTGLKPIRIRDLKMTVTTIAEL